MGFALYTHFLNYILIESNLPNINESTNSTKKCISIPGAKNGTFLVALGGFESIAEVLLTNSVAFLVLLLVFTCLSKKAWSHPSPQSNYSTTSSWIQLFYGDANSTVKENLSDGVKENFPENWKKGCCFWLYAMLKIRDEHILYRAGVDGILYLSFQRHMILYVIIISFIGVLVLIPVDFQGTLEPDEKYMARTTISNLDPSSPLLWVHPVISSVYVIICMIVLRHFSTLEEITEKETYDKRTLMITNILKDYRNVQCLDQYFRLTYPSCTIEEIHFAFDVRRLTNLYHKRDNCITAIAWCESSIQATGVKPKLQLSLCSSCCAQNDALDFYNKRKCDLDDEISKEINTVLGNPLGIAFVTFQTKQMASMIIIDDSLRKKKQQIHLALPELARKWKVKYAPASRNIFWENLAVTPKRLYFNILLVNVCIFIFVFFLTTPNIIVSGLGLLQWSENAEPSDPFLSKYIPTLVLLALSLTLPLVVAYSDLFVSYYTRLGNKLHSLLLRDHIGDATDLPEWPGLNFLCNKEFTSVPFRYNYWPFCPPLENARSAQNISMMAKTFVYLIIMIIILPSTELTSADAFIRKATTVEEERFRWECVFLPDNGAFFSTYLLQSGFIGTVIQLIRFPELAMYTLLTCLSRSKAENVAIRKAVMWEYEFGLQYAYFLLNVAIIIIFAIPAPLVPPCGLFYLLFKYHVDRYNIYFVYTPVKVSKAVHSAAINLVILCLSIQHLFLFLSSFIRNGADAITLVYFIGFVITVTMFLVHLYMPPCFFLYWLTLPHVRKQMMQRMRCRKEADHLSRHSVEISEVMAADEDVVPCVEEETADIKRLRDKLGKVVENEVPAMASSTGHFRDALNNVVVSTPIVCKRIDALLALMLPLYHILKSLWLSQS